MRNLRVNMTCFISKSSEIDVKNLNTINIGKCDANMTCFDK